MSDIDETINNFAAAVRKGKRPAREFDVVVTTAVSTKKMRCEDQKSETLEADTLLLAETDLQLAPGQQQQIREEYYAPLLAHRSGYPYPAPSTPPTDPAPGLVQGSNFISNPSNGSVILLPKGPGRSGPGELTGLYIRDGVTGPTTFSANWQGDVECRKVTFKGLGSIAVTNTSATVLRATNTSLTSIFETPSIRGVAAAAVSAPSGIIFGPGNQPLSYFNTNIISVSIVDGSGAGSAVITGSAVFTRIGAVVFLSLPAATFVIANTGTLTLASGTIPAAFRNTSTYQRVHGFYASVNGTRAPVIVLIDGFNGTLTMWSDIQGSAQFTAGQNVTLSGVATYTVI